MKTAKGRVRLTSGQARGRRWILAGGAICCVLWLCGLAGAQSRSDFARRVRIIETARLGLSSPVGVGFSSEADQFLIPQAGVGSGETDLALISQMGRRVGTARIATAIPDPLNMAFDGKARRLLFYDAGPDQILEVPAGPDGIPSAEAEVRLAVAGVGVRDARGMTVDPVSGRIFVLDNDGPRLVVVTPEVGSGQAEASVSTVDLKPFAPGALRGLAFDPTSGNLHVLGLAEQRLYEITPAGLVVANRGLSAFGLQDPQGLAFAPSGDQTDDPLEMSLYVAERGEPDGGDAAAAGQISEISLIPVPSPRGLEAR